MNLAETLARQRIPQNLRKHVAEVMACCDPDLVKRRQHRIDKINQWPPEVQVKVREIVNEIIAARRKK